MKRNWGTTVLRITDALEQLGPMTSDELAKHLGMSRDNVAPVVSRMSKPSLRPPGPKRIYIKSWLTDQEGQRNYPRALYALGSKPDAKKPQADRNSVVRRYTSKKKSLLRTVSVFNLAQVSTKGINHDNSQRVRQPVGVDPE